MNFQLILQQMMIFGMLFSSSAFAAVTAPEYIYSWFTKAQIQSSQARYLSVSKELRAEQQIPSLFSLHSTAAESPLREIQNAIPGLKSRPMVWGWTDPVSGLGDSVESVKANQVLIQFHINPSATIREVTLHGQYGVLSKGPVDADLILVEKRGYYGLRHFRQWIVMNPSVVTEMNGSVFALKGKVADRLIELRRMVFGQKSLYQQEVAFESWGHPDPAGKVLDRVEFMRVVEQKVLDYLSRPFAVPPPYRVSTGVANCAQVLVGF